MGRKITLELPDEIYDGLQEIAPQLGMTTEEAVVHWLWEYGPRSKQVDEAVSEAAWLRLRACAGAPRSGDLQAADNEAIDADMARDHARGL